MIDIKRVARAICDCVRCDQCFAGSIEDCAWIPEARVATRTVLEQLMEPDEYAEGAGMSVVLNTEDGDLVSPRKVFQAMIRHLLEVSDDRDG